MGVRLEVPAAERTVVAVIDHDDGVVCAAPALAVRIGSTLEPESALHELVRDARASDGQVSGTVDVGGTEIELTAELLHCGDPGAWVVVQQPTTEPVLERARAVVDQAAQMLDDYRQDVDRLQRLAEALLEAGNAVAVVDSRRRITGWSPAAEAMWGISHERATGKQLFTTTVRFDLDAALAGEAVRVTTPDGPADVRAKALGPDGDAVVVFHPPES